MTVKNTRAMNRTAMAILKPITYSNGTKLIRHDTSGPSDHGHPEPAMAQLLLVPPVVTLTGLPKSPGRDLSKVHVNC